MWNLARMFIQRTVQVQVAMDLGEIESTPLNIEYIQVASND